MRNPQASIRVVNGIEAIDASLHSGAITIGNFDGIHLGHRQLIQTVLEEAKTVSGPSIVLTFDPPPLQLLRPERAPTALTWMDRRIALLDRLGVDALIILRTTLELLELPPEDFFNDILLQRLKIKSIVEGPNFHFGKDRRGDIAMLDDLCQQANIGLQIANGLMQDGHWISSSRVRALIASGDIDHANQLLVEPYKIRGIVAHGAARGRSIGFPTANIEQINVLTPAHGVYAGAINVDGATHRAAIHIGPNPTFEDKSSKVEVHVIDFQGDLYDKIVDVAFLKRLRAVERFASIEELVSQLHRDVSDARRVALPS